MTCIIGADQSQLSPLFQFFLGSHRAASSLRANGAQFSLWQKRLQPTMRNGASMFIMHSRGAFVTVLIVSLRARIQRRPFRVISAWVTTVVGGATGAAARTGIASTMVCLSF